MPIKSDVRVALSFRADGPFQTEKPMNDTKHQEYLLKSVIRSLYDPTAYSNLARRSAGQALIYLLVFSLLCAAITAVPLTREINASLLEAGRTFSAEFPDFIFTPQGFKVKGRVPVISAEDQNFVWVFDPSGKTDESILDGYQKGVYLSNEGVLYKKSAYETRHYSLDSLKEYAPITKNDVEQWISYHWVLTAFIVFLFLSFSVTAKVFSALIVSLLGLFAGAVTKRRTSFDLLFRLAMYALTLPIIIKTAASAAGIDIPWFFVFYYGIALFYLHRGVAAVPVPPPDGAGADRPV